MLLSTALSDFSNAGKVQFLCKVPKKSKLSYLNLSSVKALFYFVFMGKNTSIAPVSSCHKNDNRDKPQCLCLLLKDLVAEKMKNVVLNGKKHSANMTNKTEVEVLSESSDEGF